jgi:hypothetical protein
MEYVPGESAGALLKRRKAEGRDGIDELDAVEIAWAATRGLAAAHELHVVHRDVKPDNILIPDGRFAKAKLADLGLAKPEGSDKTHGTESRVAMGTPGYMAPEQVADAKRAGPAADVFAMGATLYALLTGRSPFAGTSVAAILRDTESREPDPLPASVSPGLREVVHACLAKDPARRYADAKELLKAIETVRAGGVPPAAAGATEETREYRFSGIAPAVGVLSAGVLGVLAAGVAAPLYAGSVWLLPFAYVNPVLTFLAAAGVGTAVGYGARLGRIRAPRLTAGIGAVAAFWFSTWRGGVASGCARHRKGPRRWTRASAPWRSPLT